MGQETAEGPSSSVPPSAFQVNLNLGQARHLASILHSLDYRELTKAIPSLYSPIFSSWYGANISIPGCNKNMPGTIMAMGRLNRPSLMIYGGTIRPGHLQGHSYDIVFAFQCYGEFVSGYIDNGQRINVVRNACSGAGACSGMYTVNTMASAVETMGMTLPHNSSIPAEDPQKKIDGMSSCWEVSFEFA